MKIAHRVPAPSWFAAPESDPVDDGYAIQVQQATERGEHEHRQLCERLARAERRLAAIQVQQARAGHRKRLAQLQRLVSERRAELAEYERLMAAPVTVGKRVRFRTGLDDHLELGFCERPARRRKSPAP